MTRKESLTVFLFIGVFLTVIYLLNTFFWFSSDDCYYALMPQVNEGGIRPHLGTFWNVWQVNVADGHRPIVHFFVRLFTGCLGKGAFNIANTVMAGCLLLILHRCAVGVWAMSFRKAVWMVMLVFLILFKGESYLWCAGSCNYLWAGTATLVFYLFYEQLEKKAVSEKWVLLMGVVSLFIGWAQEAFSLPICFALGCYSVIHLKQLSWSKVVVYGCYGIGTLLLAWISGRRLATTPAFSLSEWLVTWIKIAIACKAVWILALVWCMNQTKRAFLKRNQFALFVIAGSILMIAAVGFNGERSLWAANLFAILILVREVTLPRCVTVSVTACMVPLWVFVLLLGSAISNRFEVFDSTFRASNDDVTIHERVSCGVLARFFHQSIYVWQEGGHGKVYAQYTGKRNSPIALTEKLYNELYLTGTYCQVKRRLPIEGSFFTEPDEHTIVMPLNAYSGNERFVANVEYAIPHDLKTRLKLEYAMRKNPPPSDAHLTRVLKTPHGNYLLIAKRSGADAYIKRIDVKRVYQSTSSK